MDNWKGILVILSICCYTELRRTAIFKWLMATMCLCIYQSNSIKSQGYPMSYVSVCCYCVKVSAGVCWSGQPTNFLLKGCLSVCNWLQYNSWVQIFRNLGIRVFSLFILIICILFIKISLLFIRFFSGYLNESSSFVISISIIDL